MSTSVSSLTSNFYPSPQNGFTTTTSGSVSSGAVTVGLASVAGYNNGDIATLVIDPTDASKKQTFTGIVDTSGIQITSVVWTAGTNQAHALGATVVDYATATHIAQITKGLLSAGLNQDGTITPKAKTSINDVNGNEIIKTPATASAVNEITVTNAATTVAPKISATGGDTNVNLNLVGKGTGSVQINGTDILGVIFDHVVSGIVASPDNIGVNNNYSITSGVVCIGGNFLTVAAVSAQTVGASKDRYIDLRDNGDGTAAYITNEVNNNAASQALTAGDMRVGIIVGGASSIAGSTSVNQGQESKTLPIASSIPYTVTDSLGNLICPRDPNRKILGYRRTVASPTATTQADVTGLLVPVIVPVNRKIRITHWHSLVRTSGASGQAMLVYLYEGSTFLTRSSVTTAGATFNYQCPIDFSPASVSSGLHTYKIQMATTSGTITMDADDSSSFGPAFIRVELM